MADMNRGQDLSVFETATDAESDQFRSAEEYCDRPYVRSFNASAVDGVDPVFHRGEKPWEIHYLPGHRTIGP